MSEDPDERSAQSTERAMNDEAGRMEARLDELGDHVADARKKAEHTREAADLPGDDAIETVAGDASERTTSSDDPTSAVVDPEDDD